jgi:ribonuclease HI
LEAWEFILVPKTQGRFNPYHDCQVQDINQLQHRNVSEPLAGTIQTNNRAELTAIIRAVMLAPKDRDILIKSDSRYSIDCYTNWYKTWRRKNWLTAGKKTPVENRDLIELGREKIEGRDVLGVKTSFEWLRGHANEPGNEAADRLAYTAAEFAKRVRSLS